VRGDHHERDDADACGIHGVRDDDTDRGNHSESNGVRAETTVCRQEISANSVELVTARCGNDVPWVAP